MIEKGAILPLFYLPPVEYFVLLNQCKPNFVVERYEHFPKQTFRNRTNVCSPDGSLGLTVPVVKGSKMHTPFKDVRISYDFKWQRLHWLSLQTCYRSSAYFEYYEADFAVFYERPETFLFDYNEKLLRLLLKQLKIKTEINLTETYEPAYPELTDLRRAMSPKLEADFNQKPYFQVFEDRQGFLKNLSIVDLLFNQGPHAGDYLASPNPLQRREL